MNDYKWVEKAWVVGPDMNSTDQNIRKIPSFSDNSDAIKWFKNKYEDKFVYITLDHIDDQKMYIYYLILDEVAFRLGMKQLEKNTTMTDPMKFLGSHQKIELYEYGHIHIAH
ncbi:hypothetical protein [Cytobacillus purgationiresistens]|uniref:Uncharacterized protein n=1 Tax=Cytobacillus purgationiresistens TaxID=863449 RepID=A0ABU0AJ37_9BACI|nr:hypothetical protein [Cytobacillus purgationiresistens]MDQ0271262.1 hypothetical protein [Cytobacillus purgationiresistens]